MRRARWKRKNALCQTLRRRRKVWQIRGSCGSVRRASETPLSLRLTPVLEESGPRMTTAANKQGGQRINQRPFPLPRVWQMPKACQPALDDLHGRWALPWHTRMAVMPVGADPVCARFCRSAEREMRVLPPTADGGGIRSGPSRSGIVPPQGHGHAAGTAPAPAQLRAGDGVDPDARLLQGAVGDVVPGVDHHLAGGDGQGVGPVAPLLPGGVDLAALAAGDQLDPAQLQVLLEISSRRPSSWRMVMRRFSSSSMTNTVICWRLLGWTVNLS